MHYAVWVRRGERTVWLEEYALDFVPAETIEHMAVEVVDKQLGLCALCDAEGRRCHVLVPTGRRPGEYALYCPVLWWDVFRPSSWKVEELV